jgi:hypothetical protein
MALSRYRLGELGTWVKVPLGIGQRGIAAGFTRHPVDPF